MEKSPENCDNFMKPNHCNPKIIANYAWQKKERGKEVSFADLTPERLKEEAEICRQCPNFVHL